MISKIQQNIILKTIKPFKPKRVGLFGSYVRNEQKKGSDLDILVDFDDSINLFQLIELENMLSELLGIKVDLVTEKSVSPYLKKYIYNDLVILTDDQG
jgi:uncharacterized protein